MRFGRRVDCAVPLPADSGTFQPDSNRSFRVPVSGWECTVLLEGERLFYFHRAISMW